MTAPKSPKGSKLPKLGALPRQYLILVAQQHLGAARTRWRRPDCVPAGKMGLSALLLDVPDEASPIILFSNQSARFLKLQGTTEADGRAAPTCLVGQISDLSGGLSHFLAGG